MWRLLAQVNLKPRWHQGKRFRRGVLWSVTLIATRTRISQASRRLGT